MINKVIILVVFTFAFYPLQAQTISGNLKLLSNQPIKLEGFNGFKTYPIAAATTDEQGNFELKFSSADYGVAYLKTGDEKPFFLILSNENTVLNGELLSYRESLKFTAGSENRLFELYAIEHPKREQALSAWIYLQKIYEGDSLFAKHKATKSDIEKEKQRILHRSPVMWQCSRGGLSRFERVVLVVKSQHCQS